MGIASRSRGSPSLSATSARSMRSPSPLSRVRSPRSSGRTARARPRRCGCCSGWSSRPAVRRPSAARSTQTSPIRGRRRGLLDQVADVTKRPSPRPRPTEGPAHYAHRLVPALAGAPVVAGLPAGRASVGGYVSRTCMRITVLGGSAQRAKQCGCRRSHCEKARQRHTWPLPAPLFTPSTSPRPVDLHELTPFRTTNSITVVGDEVSGLCRSRIRCRA